MPRLVITPSCDITRSLVSTNQMNAQRIDRSTNHTTSARMTSAINELMKPMSILTASHSPTNSVATSVSPDLAMYHQCGWVLSTASGRRQRVLGIRHGSNPIAPPFAKGRRRH